MENPCQPSRTGRGDQGVYLIRDIERFLNKRNISAARFGRDAMGDPRFVFDLRKGREPRERTVRRIKAYLEHRV